MEEEISRNIGAVMTEGGSPDLTNIDSDSDSVDQIYDISAMRSQMISSVKFTSVSSRNASESNGTVQDVPKAETFQSKGHCLTVFPEELS